MQGEAAPPSGEVASHPAAPSPPPLAASSAPTPAATGSAPGSPSPVTAAAPADAAVVSPPAPAEQPSPAPPRLPGFEHDATKRTGVYQLGLTVILAAVFGIVPAIMDIFDHLRSPISPGVAPWAYLLLLAGTVQMAYAMYVMQLVDWSSVRMVSVFLLVLAAGYAMLLGLLLLGDRQNPVILTLGLGDKLDGHKATGWCLVMVSITGWLAYFAGRMSARWRYAFSILTSVMASRPPASS